jgi:hypothetical protein
MNRDQLLRSIAETGYNVGFGARKTFATFDIVEKAPGWIGISSFAAGIFALFNDQWAEKTPSALLLIIGVAALYFGFYRAGDYEATAKKLLGLHNRLKHLYRSVQSNADLDESQSKLHDIELEYYSVTVSKQVFLSDWYAHYKFFAQSQTDWMNEQLKFKFWKDMIPLSAKIVLFCLLAGVIGWIAKAGITCF